MSFLFRGLKNVFTSTPLLMDGSQSLFSLQQVRRNNWPDWRMLRDHNKRMCLKQHGAERDRMNTLRFCDILPRELREVAEKEVREMPRNSNHRRTWPRCVITSRARGTQKHWRVSRFVFRHLADYNKLSGVQRAVW